ncbi:MAG TPA: TetR/AcrR family transcriptional regulator [Candidatus Acidoferrales bacterium]|nr:TetR/AcrR family transcriptional regulator [Candidatus Acidoferrales bacterium]
MDPTAELRERDALLDRIRVYVDRVGLSALTLERAAAAIGVTAEVLRGYFESKEDLIVAMIARNRIRLRERFAKLDLQVSSDEFRRLMWNFYVDTIEDSRLFYEAYGLALYDNHYGDFLHGINDWLALLRESLVRRGIPSERAEAFATLSLAVFRGAMMDLLATGERARVNAAMEEWFRAARWLSE